MTTFPFDAFIRLVEFDQQIKGLNQQIDTEEQTIVALRRQKSAALLELDQIKQTVHDMQKIVDEQELEMKVLDERSAGVKHALDQVSGAKEYTSLKKELETIHQQQHALEDTLVDAWHQLENAQRTMQQKSESTMQLCATIEADLADHVAGVEKLIEKADAMTDSRPEQMHTIPEEWLEKYESMYERVNNPVVPVADGACGGCFYPVAHQDVARLKRRALLQCTSCYRFLYDPAALQQG
jgi:predicted  nucleic acid-binding Zn-ribbon protein